jgi:hypothetical protein
VSDTPRTESFNCYDNGCDNPLHAWGAFSAELERELKSANERIKRLEEVGDNLSDCADQIGWTSCESPQWIKKAENAVKEWRKAKEDKP